MAGSSLTMDRAMGHFMHLGAVGLEAAAYVAPGQCETIAEEAHRGLTHVYR